jgi:regulatory protein
MISLTNQDETQEEAFAVAVRYISYRPRTEQETRSRLLKLYPNKVIEPVIQRCYKNDLLNDQRFSDMWVESRNNSRPKSALMVKKELLSKGVSEEISLSAIKSISDSQNAVIVAHKKSRALRCLPKDKFYEKLIAHLLRKGFGHYTSKIATDTAWEKLDNS